MSQLEAPPTAERLALSALVASRNESRLLGRCLDSIAFCDERIVIDLESDDATAQVATTHGARVVRHPFVPVVELARAAVASQARHPWLLITDPDEEIPAALAQAIRDLLGRLPDNVAVVDAPLQYRFRNRPLRGTIWGGENSRRLLIRRDVVELVPRIWSGMEIRDGFDIFTMQFTPETAITHRWADSYADLFRKHRRYLAIEPAHRARAGEVTGWREVSRIPWRSFHESFVRKKGYRDGARGFALSLFWAGFRTLGELRLLRATRALA